MGTGLLGTPRPRLIPVTRLAPVAPRVVMTEVAGEPVLQGALLTALAETREEVFTSTLA